MYKIGLALVIAVAGGCSGEPPEPDEGANQAQIDTGGATAAVDSHAGHVMEDTASGGANPADAMAGMDHGTASLAGPAEHAGHAEAQHSGAAESHARMGHVPPAATSPGGTMPADHSQHAQVAVSPEPSPTSGAEHSQHAVASPTTDAARAAAPAHQGMDHSQTSADPLVGHGQAPGAAPVTAGAAPGMDKLMTLVAELVQDSVVQRRIEQDSILRRQWEDLGVRQIILRRQ
jgi:hypothetical protein